MKLKIIATFLTCTLLISETCFAQTNFDNEIQQLEQSEDYHPWIRAAATGAEYGAITVGTIGFLAGLGAYLFCARDTNQFYSPNKRFVQDVIEGIGPAAYAGVTGAAGGAFVGGVFGCISGVSQSGIHEAKNVLRKFSSSGLSPAIDPKHRSLSSPEIKSDPADSPLASS